MRMYKRVVSLLVVIISVFSVFTQAFALSDASSKALVNQYEVPNGIDEDQWEDERGVPTAACSLPYTANATIASSVYTKYYFHPSSSGNIYTTFAGSIATGTGTAKITIKLYKIGQSGAIESHTYPAATSWSNLNLQWGGSGLDPTSYYYFKISKNNNLLNHVTFSLSIKKVA